MGAHLPILERSASAGAGGKAGRASPSLSAERLQTLASFVLERFDQVEIPLPVGGHTIGLHAKLGKTSDLVGELLRFLSRLALGHDPVAQAHSQRLLSAHSTAGE